MSDSQIHTIKEIAQKISQEDDRRSRLSHTINELLGERQDVLVCYCELAALEASKAPLKETLSKLKSFNQMLMDYFGLSNQEQLLRTLGDDFRYIHPIYRGPELRTDGGPSSDAV